MALLFGPVPTGGEQAVVLVLTGVLVTLGAVFWGSIARRWWEGLKRVPGAYRRGKRTDDESGE